MICTSLWHLVYKWIDRWNLAGKGKIEKEYNLMKQSLANAWSSIVAVCPQFLTPLKAFLQRAFRVQPVVIWQGDFQKVIRQGDLPNLRRYIVEIGQQNAIHIGKKGTIRCFTVYPKLNVNFPVSISSTMFSAKHWTGKQCCFFDKK